MIERERIERSNEKERKKWKYLGRKSKGRSQEK